MFKKKSKKNAIRMSTGEKIFQTTNVVFMILFAFTTVYPFIYFLACSFNDGTDLMRGGIYFFPRKFTLENYIEAFKNPDIISGFKITIFRTLVGTFSQVLVMSMAGYALTFKKMPGRSFIVFFMYVPTWISGGIVPTYVLYRSLGLLNNIWVYILPGLSGIWGAILFRTYFDTIPESLPESSRIDGANEWHIFSKIMMPLALPMIATQALFAGVAAWNEWFTGEYYVTKQSLRPAAAILRQLINEVSLLNQTKIDPTLAQGFDGGGAARQPTVTAESLRMTFVVIITLPIVCVYPFLQKYFMKGMMIGAVKG